MFKFRASIIKELQLLLSDKIGLMLLFGMPIVLVFIITIVQDSAYKMVNENKISLIIVNDDQGQQSEDLIHLINKSGLFSVIRCNSSSISSLKDEMIKRKIVTGLFIPENFSKLNLSKASIISKKMLAELGMIQNNNEIKLLDNKGLVFYHDPILTENYCQSIEGMFKSYVSILENKLMIKSFYSELGVEDKSDDFQSQVNDNQTQIKSLVATRSNEEKLPNSSQHNVPAWTIFAMFFMVTSLGGNVAKEKVSGSFMRLKTLPTSFFMMLSSKMFVYLMVAFLQILVIFSIGVFIFPSINLPKLNIPTSFLPMFVIVFLTGFSAVSYALVVGVLSKTQEQANGFGAISIIIFAAIGGVWVPTFVMPEYLQIISNISPLNWCLKGFYVLFLRHGSWSELLPIISYLSLFILLCQTIVLVRLKSIKLL
jgi:ABC-2 type transport system permease protein